MKIDKVVEDKLLSAVEKDHNLDIGEYQKVNMYLFGKKTFKEMLKKCKFKTVGNIFDMLDTKRSNYLEGFNSMEDFKHTNCVCISKKNKSILIYTRWTSAYECLLISNVKYIKTISKLLKPIVESSYSMDNAFEKVDFKCGPATYMEISEPTKEDEKVKAIKRKVADENLVFDDKSTLSDILKDVNTFFNKDTQKLYDQLQIPYKRGLMLYGPPGNGKSALIREIIRTVPSHITKVCMDTNIYNFTQMLSLLVQKINGEPSILIIEDIDSVVNADTRSMFLNIIDGINASSGLFIIGTTNYIEKLDSALINRSGRFDKTYYVGSPSDNVRREYFNQRELNKLLVDYSVFAPKVRADTMIKNVSLSLTDIGRKIVFKGNDPIVELFTTYSKDLPMANLKEVMINTQYLLANDKTISIEEAVKKSTSVIKKNIADHQKASKNYNNNNFNSGWNNNRSGMSKQRGNF